MELHPEVETSCLPERPAPVQLSPFLDNLASDTNPKKGALDVV